MMDGSGLLEGQRGAEERPVPVTSGGEEEEDPISRRVRENVRSRWNLSGPSRTMGNGQ